MKTKILNHKTYAQQKHVMLANSTKTPGHAKPELYQAKIGIKNVQTNINTAIATPNSRQLRKVISSTCAS